MRVALLFIDGVGIGQRDPAVNPLARDTYLLSRFGPDGAEGEPLPCGGTVHALDTTFGVRGRPQSATNQAALLTGEPAPALLGRHLLGFPNPALRELIARRSIVARLVEAGLRARLATCYPAAFLDAVGLPHRPGPADVAIPAPARRRLKASAIPLAFAAAGVELGTLEDARAGAGLTHDVDGARARSLGFDVPARTPDEAAATLWQIASGADFVAFEHYSADEAGHARDFEAAARALSTFDRFARALVRSRPADACVLVCSDHGNVEDLSVRGHTTHPVAALSFGAPGLLDGARTVADVGLAVLRALGAERAGARPRAVAR